MTTTSDQPLMADTGARPLAPRWIPLTGIAFVLTILASFVVQGDTPRIDRSAADVVSFWTDNHANGVSGAYVLAWAAVLFLIFAAALVREALAASTQRTVWHFVMTAGGILCTGGLLGSSWTLFTVAEVAEHGGSEQSIVALSALNANTPVLFTGGLGIMLFGAAGAYIPRTGSYRLLGWAAVVLGIGFYVPSFVSLIAALLSVPWIIATAIVVTRNTSSSDA